MTKIKYNSDCDIKLKMTEEEFSIISALVFYLDESGTNTTYAPHIKSLVKEFDRFSELHSIFGPDIRITIDSSGVKFTPNY